MRVWNLHAAALERMEGAPEGVDFAEAQIGEAIGAEHLAGNLVEIAPRRRSWPYHWEAPIEEWALVVAGTPVLRTPEGEETLAPGDLVCFPPGPDGAHQLRNDTDEPVRVLMLSDRAGTRVAVYPDNGQVAVDAPGLQRQLRGDAHADYWEGA